MKKLIFILFFLPLTLFGQEATVSYVDYRPYVSALSKFHMENYMDDYVNFVIIGDRIKESALNKKDAQHKLEKYYDKDLRIRFVSENNYGRMITCAQIDNDGNTVRYFYLHLAWDNKSLIQSIEVETIQ